LIEHARHTSKKTALKAVFSSLAVDAPPLVLADDQNTDFFAKKHRDLSVQDNQLKSLFYKGISC
jgi:hypothetical protein